MYRTDIKVGTVVRVLTDDYSSAQWTGRVGANTPTLDPGTIGVVVSCDTPSVFVRMFNGSHNGGRGIGWWLGVDDVEVLDESR